MNDGPRTLVLVSALIVLLIGGLLVSYSGVAWAEDRAQIDRLFEEARDLWERGDSAGAAEKLKALLAADPSYETAYDLLRKAEYQMFLDLLTQGGDSEKIAKALLRLAERGELSRTRDEAAIRGLVDKAVHATDYATRVGAVRELVQKHGEYAVPDLHKFLGSNDTDERVNAILALSELSLDAVMPLIEALQSDDWRIQQNSALVLQKIGDARAIGALASLAMHAENESVKDAAGQAAASLAMKIGDEGMAENMLNPVNAYLWLAERYYERNAVVIKNYLGTFTLWSMKDGALANRDVPRYLYHLELAEEAAYDALREQPGEQLARSMLAAIHYAQVGALEGLPAEAKSDEAVQALMESYWNVLPITAAQGTETQLGALDLGLMWGDGAVARGALEALPGVWDGRWITEDSPLARALTSDDKTVRFTAAIACLMINPPDPYTGSEMVVPIAAQAADTGSVRQILLIEPNAELRSSSLLALQDAGIFAVAEENGAAGFARAKEVGTFDAIVIRATLPDDLALAVVNELRKDFRTENVPVIITGLGEEMDAAKELFKTDVTYAAADPIEVEVVMSTVSGSLNTDQKAALKVSKAACEALAGIDKTATAFTNYTEAEGALVGVLSSNKPDDIRLAALAALARIGTTTAIDGVMDTFGKTANATSVRVAAALALGGILNGQAAPAKVFEALTGGLGDEAREARAACGIALGQMILTSEQQNHVLMMHRVE